MAKRLSAGLPSASAVLAGPELRCRQTAEAAGLTYTTDPALAESEFGAWAGLSFEEVQAACPDQAERWMRDPNAAPHGGESIAQLSERVAGWLSVQAQARGYLVAITHAGVIRAAILCALKAPLASFWAIDVSPLAITELHSRTDGWALTRTNCAIAPSRPTAKPARAPR
jgi:broad specificity phosphatase PhoE